MAINMSRLWRFLGPDREALTPAIARAAFEHLAEGLAVPSARRKGGVNIIYYPSHRRDGTVIQTLNPAALPPDMHGLDRYPRTACFYALGSRRLLAGNGAGGAIRPPYDVRELCERYGLKREERGRLTGFSLRALAEWASGQLPSQPAKRRLKEIRRLLDALSEIVQRERIPEWLHRPNPAFAPLTPMQVIELGEIDRLWAMVHGRATGQPD